MVSAEVALGKGNMPAFLFGSLSEGEIPTTRAAMGWRRKVLSKSGR